MRAALRASLAMRVVLLHDVREDLNLSMKLYAERIATAVGRGCEVSHFYPWCAGSSRVPQAGCTDCVGLDRNSGRPFETPRHRPCTSSSYPARCGPALRPAPGAGRKAEGPRAIGHGWRARPPARWQQLVLQESRGIAL